MVTQTVKSSSNKASCSIPSSFIDCALGVVFEFETTIKIIPNLFVFLGIGGKAVYVPLLWEKIVSWCRGASIYMHELTLSWLAKPPNNSRDSQ